MAIKTKNILNPEVQVTIPGLGLAKDLFDPQFVIQDDTSLTVLQPQRIVGFHTRKIFIEKAKDTDGIFKKDFEILVPATTKHAITMLEDITLTYGEIEVKGNLQEPVMIIKPDREVLAYFITSATIRRLGDIELLNGGPQLVRKALLRININLASDRGGTWGGFLKLNVLFLGE